MKPANLEQQPSFAPGKQVQLHPLSKLDYREFFLRHHAAGVRDVGIASMYSLPLLALSRLGSLGDFVLEAWNKAQILGTSIDASSAEQLVLGAGLALGEVALERVGSGFNKIAHADSKLLPEAVTENADAGDSQINDLMAQTARVDNVPLDYVEEEYKNASQLPKKARPMNPAAYRDFWLRRRASGGEDLTRSAQLVLPLIPLIAQFEPVARLVNDTIHALTPIGEHLTLATSEMGVAALGLIAAGTAVSKGISGINKIRHANKKLKPEAIIENKAVLNAALTAMATDES